ncbi:MAG TPA: inositol monophosphatase family protein [Candidatus Macondimonas sp.]|nr:inositol monophosphatase family protein [Candidatus Macondimonas sp.]
MHPLLTIAVRAARRAGDVILRATSQSDALTIEAKQRNDFVTEIDRQAEQEIIQIIRRAYPDHAILGEEGGQIGEHDVTWIIDPLDGTTNFIHGLPHYAVSIGIRIRGRLEHGVIHDPTRGEIYTATRGSGSFLNDRRIRIATARGLDGALIGTGLPFRDFSHAQAYYGMLQAIAAKTAGIRRAGSAALDLAYVASGRLDGYWELGLKPWDIAAGVVLVQEAGGIVGSLSGEPEGFMESGNLVCGNPRVFAALVREIEPHLTPMLRVQSRP